MRYIDIHKIVDSVNLLDWEEIRQSHLNTMDGMSVSDRKQYITNHPDWNKLQAVMLGLSHNKCWYSEAPIGNGDLEVDHFRPKNKSKQKIDYNIPKSKSITNTGIENIAFTVR
jgi:hypothetical protein